MTHSKHECQDIFGRITVTIGMILVMLTAGCTAQQLDQLPALSKPDQQHHYLKLAQQDFQRGSFGLSEKNFRKAVEIDPKDEEAWLGLAATYDHLTRYDLADRSYARAKSLMGESPALLNNMGYSKMLRGDLRAAKTLLAKAWRLDPSNPRIASNIEELNTRLEQAGGEPIKL
ncbi:MAG: tetratricopeptide repeat protein [Hyphomicrobiaceae bacterium]